MVGSFAAFIIYIAFFVFLIWMGVRILHRTGFSGWWIILMFVPLVNVIMFWIFAFIRWPNQTTTIDNIIQ